MKHHLLDILIHWPRPYISGTDLRTILNKSPHSRYGIIKRFIQESYLLPIKKDFYLIQNLNRKLALNLFEIAPLIYGPSCISFESALSHFGWIPEAVRTTTCACVKRKKEFETPVGVFSYERIPIEIFSVGITQQIYESTTLFIASPIKAIADMIYARKRTWSTIDHLCEDLRIEFENIETIDKELILELIKFYPCSRVKDTLSIILKGV